MRLAVSAKDIRENRLLQLLTAASTAEVGPVVSVQLAAVPNTGCNRVRSRSQSISNGDASCARSGVAAPVTATSECLTNRRRCGELKTIVAARSSYSLLCAKTRLQHAYGSLRASAAAARSAAPDHHRAQVDGVGHAPVRPDGTGATV